MQLEQKNDKRVAFSTHMYYISFSPLHILLLKATLAIVKKN